ncbi:metallophosphoesterase [Gemmobacter sp.]|uniref:metallophosphoesterase n=1 Tax=Gemmobacter sp. TaxID=1898957 RepID=UPI0025C4D28C|nr:metallophosphoesterase [Gemmobacter sp.]
MLARRAAPVRPLPGEPLFLLPDLHGALPLLQAALARKAEAFAPHRLVVLGDMLDRGADSAGVVRCLMGLPEAICLMGNHEAMLLDVLDDPARHGAAWLRHGGLETLLSFGMQGLPRDAAELADMAADLRRRMGAAMIGWLRERPLYWQSGNVVAVHAGLDPRKALARQSRETLLWGHPAFGRGPRRDGLFVVHGHSIVPQARIAEGRLMLDTGAYATGTLSFSVMDPGSVMDSGRADIYSLRLD